MGTAWYAGLHGGQLLSVRAEPPLFCGNGGQDHYKLRSGNSRSYSSGRPQRTALPQVPEKPNELSPGAIKEPGGASQQLPRGLLGERSRHQGSAHRQEDLSKRKPECEPLLSV